MDDEKVLKTFRKRKVVTVSFLAELIGCSPTSTRRRLSRWKALTSINNNGKYYTLPDIPRFNHYGLWKFKTILFSKHGTLKNTLITFIQHSATGLTAPQLREKVGLSANSSHLSLLRESSKIYREKYHGKFIYFSADPVVLKNQKQQLQELKSVQGTTPSDAQAVALLVQFIKHPSLSSEQLSIILSQEGIELEPAVIMRFLSEHGILKKTVNTKQ